MKYKQVITSPETVADALTTLTEEGNKIHYVLPCHQWNGTVVVIVYEEAKNE